MTYDANGMSDDPCGAAGTLCPASDRSLGLIAAESRPQLTSLQGGQRAV